MMKTRIPASRETTVSEIVSGIREFRSVRPQPGTADMIERVRDLVSVYDDLGDVVLQASSGGRAAIVSALYHLNIIKRLADKGDWSAIGNQWLLYPSK